MQRLDSMLPNGNATTMSGVSNSVKCDKALGG